MARVVPLALALATLSIVLLQLPSFGPTWDMCIGEIAQGELYLEWIRTGDARFLDFSDSGARPEHRSPHPDFDHGLYLWFETNTFMGLWSALACRILWTSLAALPAMSAHLLPSVILLGLLIYVLSRFVASRAGVAATVGTVAALMLSPRFAYDAIANPKDGPEACLYALSMIAVFHAIESRSAWRWIVAAAVSACALAQKPNALFLAPHSLAWLTTLALLRRGTGRAMPRIPAWATLGAPIVFASVYLAFSPMLWSDTIARLAQHFGFFARAGSAHLSDDFPAYRAVLVTTPEVVLLLALVGCFARKVMIETRLFLAIGALFPILRATFVGGVNFDGVRHFPEFYPFLAALAGIGFSTLLSLPGRFGAATGPARGVFTTATSLALMLPLVSATANTWPYGLVYFNSSVGGFGGLQRTGHGEACDYWAASYWEGLAWIESRAKPGSVVVAPVAPHVARSIAPLRLVRNARLSEGEPPTRGGELYVIQIQRRLLDSPVADYVVRGRTPIHEVKRDGGVLCRIDRIDEPAQVAKVLELARAQARSEAAFRRARAWLLERPGLIDDLRERITAEPLRLNEILVESVPEPVRADILEFMKQIPLDRGGG